MVDLDAALGEQLLDIAVGQPEAQVPADRDDDNVGREAEAGERRTVALEQGEGGEFSCRQSRCSKAVTANATEPPGADGRPPSFTRSSSGGIG
jgi:hypothetical protein